MKQFLIQSHANKTARGRCTGYPMYLDMAQRVSISTQIAHGMRYLTSAGFLHKDLGARNCLLNSNLKVKITKLGFTKECYIPTLPRDAIKDYFYYKRQVISIHVNITHLLYMAYFGDCIERVLSSSLSVSFSLIIFFKRDKIRENKKSLSSLSYFHSPI